MMTGPADPTIVHWCIHLASPPERVFEFLATDADRAQYWGESVLGFDIDLRNHNLDRSWEQGYADN